MLVPDFVAAFFQPGGKNGARNSFVGFDFIERPSLVPVSNRLSTEMVRAFLTDCQR